MEETGKKMDIDREARWVEFFGLVGIIVFLIILALSWAVKIDITVPAQGDVKSINEKIVILADISKIYIPVIKEGQSVKVYLKEPYYPKKRILLGRLSRLSEISPEGNIKGEVIIDLEQNQRIDTGLVNKTQEVKIRVIISQQRIINLLISKKE